MERVNREVRIRSSDGEWQRGGHQLQTFDSMLSEFADPERAPELLTVRDRLRSWRFYDHFRTDAAAPARRVQIGTRTPVLGPDGADLAAALQTIREIGANGRSTRRSSWRSPAAQSVVNADGRFEIAFRQHGLLRPLSVPSSPTARSDTCCGSPLC